MNKIKTAHKAELLLALAKDNPNEHEAQAAVQAATKLINKLELGPNDTLQIKQSYPDDVKIRLNRLLNQIDKCKVWLVYRRKFYDMATRLAAVQAELEKVIKYAEEETEFKKRKSKPYNLGQLSVLRRRYL